MLTGRVPLPSGNKAAFNDSRDLLLRNPNGATEARVTESAFPKPHADGYFGNA
jgi:hypothetical protein